MSAGFLFVLCHVFLLFLSVCGLPAISRRSWAWGPGSNPKQEAVLRVLLFPAQAWVLAFLMDHDLEWFSVKGITPVVCVPHAASPPNSCFRLLLHPLSCFFMASLPTVKSTKSKCMKWAALVESLLCLSSKYLTVVLILFINISATGAPSVWPTCCAPHHRVIKLRTLCKHHP